jgi:hypothetical protein
LANLFLIDLVGEEHIFALEFYAESGAKSFKSEEQNCQSFSTTALFSAFGHWFATPLFLFSVSRIEPTGDRNYVEQRSGLCSAHKLHSSLGNS